jgi:hypothetical protein
MVYEVKGPDVQPVYNKDDDWKIAQTKGTSRDQAVALIRQDVLQGRINPASTEARDRALT